MKACVILLCHLFLSHLTHAQKGYVKELHTVSLKSFDVDGINASSSNLIIRGNVFIDSLNIWGLYVAELDTAGSVLGVQIVIDSVHGNNYNTNTPQSLIEFSDGYLLAFNILGAGEVALGIWHKGDGEFTKTIIPYDGVFMQPKYLINFDTTIFLVGVVQRSNLLFDNFVCSISLSGQVKWIKYYGLLGYEEFCSDAYINSDNTITIPSTRMTKEYSQNNEKIVGWRKPWLFTIDTTGNIINQWLGENNDQKTLAGGSGLKTKNKDWILTSLEPKQVPYFEKTILYYSPTITCLDSLFQLKWKLTLTDFTSRYDELVDLKYDSLDNTYVASGKRYVQYDPLPDESEIWVLKFTEDGEILWNITDTLFYNRKELHYTAGHVISPSGSIYVAGWVDLFSQEHRYTGFLMKVSPDGCTDTLCTTTSLQAQLEQFGQDIVMYPNPATDHLYVNLKKDFQKPILSVVDLQGQVLLRKFLTAERNEISLDLQRGIYFCTVSSEEGLLKSSKLVVTR